MHVRSVHCHSCTSCSRHTYYNCRSLAGPFSGCICPTASCPCRYLFKSLKPSKIFGVGPGFRWACRLPHTKLKSAHHPLLPPYPAQPKSHSTHAGLAWIQESEKPPHAINVGPNPILSNPSFPPSCLFPSLHSLHSDPVWFFFWLGLNILFSIPTTVLYSRVSSQAASFPRWSSLKKATAKTSFAPGPEHSEPDQSPPWLRLCHQPSAATCLPLFTESNE